MSLVDFAFRTCICNALKGRTRAGNNVFDTPVDPIDAVFEGEANRIVIGVFTNIGEITPDGKSLQNAKNTMEVQIQIYLPWSTGLAATDELGQVKGRDAGGAFVFDLISREVARALTPDTNPWADLLQTFITDYGHIRRQSFVVATETKVLEVSGKEIVYQYETISEPTPGAALDAPWTTFLDMLQAMGPGEASLAQLMRTELLSGLSVTDWQRAAAALNVSSATIEALGLGPQPQLPDDEVPEVILQEITLDNELLDINDVIVDNHAIVTEP